MRRYQIVSGLSWAVVAFWGLCFPNAHSLIVRMPTAIIIAAGALLSLVHIYFPDSWLSKPGRVTLVLAGIVLGLWVLLMYLSGVWRSVDFGRNWADVVALSIIVFPAGTVSFIEWLNN